MAVRNGFLKTEVGLIPSDWKLYSLSSIASIKTGPFGTVLNASEYSEHEGVPMISVGEIRDGYIRVSSETPRIPSVVVRRLPQFVLRSGDIVFGRKGGVERSALVKDHENGWFLGSDGINTRFCADVYSPYVAYQFRSSRIQSWLLQNAIGTTMPSLNQQILAKVVIAIPPFAEQKAIAGALSEADGWIDSLEQLVTKKQQIKQGAMHELLTGNIRLPGFIGEWEQKRLRDIGATYSGLTGKKKADFGNGSSKYVTFMNVMSNTTIDFTSFENVSVLPSEQQNHVKRGDLLFNGSSETPEEVAMCAVVVDEISDLYLNSFCFGFRCHFDAEVDGLFFAYYLRSSIGREMMKSLAQGSTRYNLSKLALLNSQLPIPKLPEQREIATILSTLDAEIAELYSKLAKARHIKQAMMQELLTGRIRLVKQTDSTVSIHEAVHG